MTDTKAKGSDDVQISKKDELVANTVLWGAMIGIPFVMLAIFGIVMFALVALAHIPIIGGVLAFFGALGFYAYFGGGASGDGRGMDGGGE